MFFKWCINLYNKGTKSRRVKTLLQVLLCFSNSCQLKGTISSWSEGMEPVSQFKINKVTDNYWLIYATATKIWPYHVGCYFQSLSLSKSSSLIPWPVDHDDIGTFSPRWRNLIRNNLSGWLTVAPNKLLLDYNLVNWQWWANFIEQLSKYFC